MIFFMTKTTRLIELLLSIQNKKKFTVDELAAEFNVSYRTMLRYLQELSGLGVPLYSEVGKHGGYYLLQSEQQKKSRLPGQQSRIGKTVIKPEFQLVGIDFEAPFTAISLANIFIPRLWSELLQRANEIPYKMNEGTWIGIVQNRKKDYMYMAGVEVTQLGQIPHGMKSMTVPTQQYLVFTHQGRREREGMDHTYFYALERIRKEGLAFNINAYCLEVYKKDPLPLNNEFDFYLPIL